MGDVRCCEFSMSVFFVFLFALFFKVRYCTDICIACNDYNKAKVVLYLSFRSITLVTRISASSFNYFNLSDGTCVAKNVPVWL